MMVDIFSDLKLPLLVTMPLWKRNFIFVWLNNFITAVGMMSFFAAVPPAPAGIGSGRSGRGGDLGGVLGCRSALDSRRHGGRFGERSAIGSAAK